ncbi:MAG: peptide deformylase [Candidatus Dadabacteria bacterium]|nr:peptide deformylase [Candidatus Dadabacteria bacterium]MYA48899.1 peptide deformylase [Candidatus Dadabacteria bacterium]MYF48455.1 peptide deformylase [Candidatus Dadabacteria bacterium]MYG83014.1 peptide deformylase [Candidatus Dadabacteria bacterium]MYK49085.1 peptide deformylase [Candidatus Dadabacteria bacterium]
MAQQREITELGNPVLRQKAESVENISDTDIQELIDDLIITAAEASGVGIAAPQVSESLRIFIIAGAASPRYPDAPETETKVIINPEIVSVSDELEKGWEGCLSIPGLRALVPRHKYIQTTYRDRNNNLVEEGFSDFAARVFQHEYDHINGVVFLDRVESSLEIITENEYMKLVAESDSEEEE